VTTVLQGWQQALAREQAAVFGYGTLGPHLATASQLALARGCEQAHRAQVALAQGALLILGGAAAESSPPYDSAPVGDASSAVELAVELEETTATGWRYLLSALATDPATSADDSSANGPIASDSIAQSRVTALAALTAAAVRAVQWRRMQNASSPSVAFPGI
jgi:uncharacterized protein DUF4439